MKNTKWSLLILLWDSIVNLFYPNKKLYPQLNFKYIEQSLLTTESPLTKDTLFFHKKLNYKKESPALNGLQINVLTVLRITGGGVVSPAEK